MFSRAPAINRANQRLRSTWHLSRYGMEDTPWRRRLLRRRDRQYGSVAYKSFRNFFKFRYFLVGSAVGGGVTLQRKISEWREGIPNFSKVKLPKLDFDKIKSLVNSNLRIPESKTIQNYAQDIFKGIMSSVSFLYTKDKNVIESGNRIAENDHVEALNIRGKYEKKIAEMENEINQLHKRNAALKKARDKTSLKDKSTIELYSEVLDSLSGYEQEWSGEDQLPRIVVVGDQSSGKTSVLECVARARIFPRGAGEMMTRAPVKVTLSEGPYHVAQFRDSRKEYDLTKESDLEELRREVELRMKNSVQGGKTVSKEVISMSVKGPGLHKMVLVDLPGIISTETVEMAADTRDSIKEMTQAYMNNPNAIILCIQDGSVDAERSNVTDLVSQCDPTGKRTIFVLTKVDLAEANLADPQRIKKILSGKLFPMKAVRYFAVVTGKGSNNDSIESIKKYEEDYFKKSKLFKNMKSSHFTTENLSKAVAECFWKMVQETVEQQADAFRAKRLNLETEWKNNFPRIRELDRDELFEKARNDILDQSIYLFTVPPKTWEEKLSKGMWKVMRSHVFENIYLPAAMTENTGSFNTTVDIKLRQWTEKVLPKITVLCGWETLRSAFNEQMINENLPSDEDDIFDKLKKAVVEETFKRYKWDNKALRMIKILQSNALQDTSIRDKSEWDDSVDFLAKSINDKIRKTEKKISKLTGPSYLESWIYWKSPSEDQIKKKHVKQELEMILKGRKQPCDSIISYEELVTVRNHLKRKNVEVDLDFIKDVWRPVHKRYFLKESLERAKLCKKGYYLYCQEETRNKSECSEVVLFWRVRQMIKMSANVLRQQITNNEVQQLHKDIRSVLDEINEDSVRKAELLTGRRVELAENLKQVRQIQEKLEEFVTVLKNEKR